MTDHRLADTFAIALMLVAVYVIIALIVSAVH
jgi:hypothetical protein